MMHAAFKLDGRKFDFNGETITCYINTYAQGGRPRIDFMDDEGPYATLTVNNDTTSLNDNEILVKTHSENKRISDYLRTTGLFKDTGRRVPTGFVQAEVWVVTIPESN